jgi:hypothetical protein
MRALKLFRRSPIKAPVSAIEPPMPLDGNLEPTPEVLLERVAVLVRERQRLRADGAGKAALEQNRRQIARAQWELSRVLIARYSPAV